MLIRIIVVNMIRIITINIITEFFYRVVCMWAFANAMSNVITWELILSNQIFWVMWLSAKRGMRSQWHWAVTVDQFLQRPSTWVATSSAHPEARPVETQLVMREKRERFDLREPLKNSISDSVVNSDYTGTSLRRTRSLHGTMMRPTNNVQL